MYDIIILNFIKGSCNEIKINDTIISNTKIAGRYILLSTHIKKYKDGKTYNIYVKTNFNKTLKFTINNTSYSIINNTVLENINLNNKFGILIPYNSQSHDKGSIQSPDINKSFILPR